MSNTGNTIYQAIVSHTAWKKRLREIIDTGENKYDVDTEHCKFGKWLKENADGLLSIYEHYPQVVHLHDQFHKEADKIIRLALYEKLQEANTAVGYGGDFDHISQGLVRALIAWHDVVIGKQ